MFNNRGSSLVSTLLALAAAGGVGVAGYYLVSGGCGSCSTEAAAATATPVAAVEGDSCCPAEADAAVVAVANEGESCEAACDKVCDEMTAEACEKACETACTGEAGEAGEVMLVANEGETCTAEKAECSEKTECSAEKEACEGEAKVCPVTGEPIADAGS